MRQFRRQRHRSSGHDGRSDPARSQTGPERTDLAHRGERPLCRCERRQLRPNALSEDFREGVFICPFPAHFRCIFVCVNITEALLESWDRQCRIVTAVASRVDETNRDVKPSEDGWPLYHQLAHIHLVRRYWLSQVAPELGSALGESYSDGWQTPITDLDAIKALLEESAKAVREGVRQSLEKGEPVGGYDHPVLFLQHMIWHEGWHVGLIFLGLRLAGQEPAEEWEEANVWGEWRTE
ncbi:MAG: DinB family protein [Oxalobacteraceae bacterium]|nr:MAG: DinB family protein [Oxalobacteraceae bacterium]